MTTHHTRLRRLAGPLILSNLTIALQGMVDTAVVGHLDTPVYIGAVAVAAVIFDFLYWGMGFLRMGTVGIVAQLKGEGNHDRLRSALLHSCFLGMVIATVILLLQTQWRGFQAAQRLEGKEFTDEDFQDWPGADSW